MDLVVKSPFDGHAVGDRITDAALVEAIRADHRAEFVTQVASAPAPTPAEPPMPASPTLAIPPAAPAEPSPTPPASSQEH